MRILIRASFPVDSASKAIKDGTLPKVIGEFAEKAKPESMYFTLRGGKRTMYAVVDMKDSSAMPMTFEPLFAQLNASIDASPCMNIDELQKGIKAAFSGK